MKRTLMVVLLTLFLASLLLSSKEALSSPAKYYYINIKVSANVDLPKGTPVVIKVGDLKKQLTGDYNWKYVYVIHDEDVIPTQVDYLGKTEDDYEIVFQLVEAIPAGEEDTYKILVAEKGITLPKPTFPETCKITIIPEYEKMAELGVAIVLENDIIQAVILNQSDWIAGTVFSAKIKATEYDIVKQGREKGTTGWRWSRYLAEGDPGWAEKNPRFKVLYMSYGPVRAVAILQSTTPHGQIEELYAVKKYSIYKGLSYVELILTVTGPGYKPDLKVPVKASFVDMGSQGLEHDTVYVPGMGDFSRMTGTAFRKENFTESWFMVYKAAENKGFGVIFYPIDDLLKFDWGSPGDELVLHYEAGIPIPFSRVLVLFDSSITNDPKSLMHELYEMHTNKPIIRVVSEEEAKLLPSTIAEAYGKTIESYEETIKELNTKVKGLTEELNKVKGELDKAKTKVSELETQLSQANKKISSLESELATARTMQWALLVVGLIIGIIIGVVIGRKFVKS